MSDDLVTRLRDAVNGEHDMTPHGADCLRPANRIRKYRLFGCYDYWGMEDAETGESVKNDCDMDWVKASDAEREIARLEGERDAYRDSYLTADRIYLRTQARAEAAEAQEAALLEAMREIVQHCQNSGRGSELVDGRIVERCEETARAAIAAAKGAK